VTEHIIMRESLNATEWRADGNFWVQYTCERCADCFYEYALQNRGMGATPRRCAVCRGERTAAQESYRNARILNGEAR
jgi:hypothetical protein